MQGYSMFREKLSTHATFLIGEESMELPLEILSELSSMFMDTQLPAQHRRSRMAAAESLRGGGRLRTIRRTFTMRHIWSMHL